MKKVVTAITTTTIAFSGASALTVSADTHEVVKRDTLWGISQHHGTSVDELMKWNKLSSTLIHPGQKISTTNDKVDKPKATVKTKDKKTKSKSDSATYTVVAGDTLSEIAFEYGVTYEELMEWNDLTTTLIYPGQELKVKKVDKKTEEAPSEEKVVSEEKAESKDKIEQPEQDKEIESEKEEVEQVEKEKETASKSDTKPTSSSKSNSNQQKPAKEITASSGDTYTVNAGDTLSEIAFAHNVSFDDLMEWNNLSDTIVVPGDTLIVNGSEKQPSKDSSNSSDESKDNEVKEEPKQEETKESTETEEPKENETSDSNKEATVDEETNVEEAPEAEETEAETSEAEKTETEKPEAETSESEEPKQEAPEQEEEQVEEVEVEVEVEEQEQTTESESSSETSSGETMTMEATAYTADCEGCTGITATGIDLKNDRNQKVIAVDPDVIPLGSTVKVDGYGTAIAGDTGGAIKGNIIDLHMPTTEDAIQWGRQEVKVEILD